MSRGFHGFVKTMSDRENKSRREAFKILGGLLVCGVASVGIVHYAFRREPSADETVRLGATSEFPVGQFQKRTVMVTEHGTWLTGPVEKTVWVRRNPDDTFLVFSGTCPHRNCTVNLMPDQTFACPCHMSAFDAQGTVTAGPAPRPLDSLEHRVSGDGVLSAQFQNFRKGLPAKELIPQS
jgi:Rieske Fe-S protein